MLSKRRMKEKERERGREERRKKENLKSFKSGVKYRSHGIKRCIEQQHYLENMLEFECQL